MNYKYFCFSFFFFLICFVSCFAQPAVQWEKSFGFGEDDKARSIIQTKDGGYIVAGESHQDDGNPLDSSNHGSFDWLVLKLDSLGNIQWQKFYGGTHEESNPIILQIDGGYLIAGYSASNDGDVDSSFVGAGAWVVKIDSLGTIQKQKKTTDFNNIIPSIKKTIPEGYILAGSSFNSDSLSLNFGSLDYMIIKIDSVGNIEWEKTFGGSDHELVNEVIQTSDNGFAIIGSSRSINGDIIGNHGNYDFWILKLDQSGNFLWEKSLGGQYSDKGMSIIENNNGYFVGGYTESDNGDVSGNHGNNDLWIAKLDSIGNIIWQKCFGGSAEEYGISMSTIDSNRIILTGSALSNDSDLTINHGDFDYWVLEIDSNGNIIWQQSYGGSMIDWPTSIQSTNDDGCIVAGYSESVDGDVTGHHGLFQNTDYWILKLSPFTVDIKETKINRIDVSITPNPTNRNITIILPEQSPIREVTITNVLGQEVSRAKYSNISMLELEVKGESGLYFVRVVEGERSRVYKVLKM